MHSKLKDEVAKLSTLLPRKSRKFSSMKVQAQRFLNEVEDDIVKALFIYLTPYSKKDRVFAFVNRETFSRLNDFASEYFSREDIIIYAQSVDNLLDIVLWIKNGRGAPPWPRAPLTYGKESSDSNRKL